MVPPKPLTRAESAPRRTRQALRVFVAACLLACAAGLHAAPLRLLTIGDSLTEEYIFEFPFSAPDSAPATANTRNWVEILHARRPGHLTMGPYSSTLGSYLDYRNAGYEYNYGVPSFTARKWEQILEASALELLTTAEGTIALSTRTELRGDLANVDAVLIFLGGNDLKSNYTGLYLDPQPPAYLTEIPEHLRDIHTWVRVNAPAGLPIIVATVPDIGSTPEITLHPSYTDPARRMLARQRVASMNQSLIDLISSLPNTYIARIDSLTDDIFDLNPFHINGTEFTYYQLPEGLENPPLHLFCKDAFHPSTVLQARIANRIVAAINQFAPSPIPVLGNREILADILKQNPDQPYIDWASANNLSPEIPHQHLIPFLLGNTAIETHPDRTLTYSPSRAALRYASLSPYESDTLQKFQPVPPHRIHHLPDNIIRIAPPNRPQNFYRLQATPLP